MQGFYILLSDFFETGRSQKRPPRTMVKKKVKLYDVQECVTSIHGILTKNTASSYICLLFRVLLQRKIVKQMSEEHSVCWRISSKTRFQLPRQDWTQRSNLGFSSVASLEKIHLRKKGFVFICLICTNGTIVRLNYFWDELRTLIHHNKKKSRFSNKLENTTYCLNMLTLNMYFTPIQQ